MMMYYRNRWYFLRVYPYVIIHNFFAHPIDRNCWSIICVWIYKTETWNPLCVNLYMLIVVSFEIAIDVPTSIKME